MAIVAGTKAETVIDVLQKIHVNICKKVREITLDMAANMELIAKRAFPNATRVTDRFHVQKLATEALQEIRIKHRWQALDAENDAIEIAKKTDTEYIPKILPNGDTVKQLLARIGPPKRQVCTLQKRERLDRKSKTKSHDIVRIIP